MCVWQCCTESPLTICLFSDGINCGILQKLSTVIYWFGGGSRGKLGLARQEPMKKSLGLRWWRLELDSTAWSTTKHVLKATWIENSLPIFECRNHSFQQLVGPSKKVAIQCNLLKIWWLSWHMLKWLGSIEWTDAPPYNEVTILWRFPKNGGTPKSSILVGFSSRNMYKHIYIYT